MEKRIWNEMELKSMSDWEYYDNSWHKFGETFTITDAMVGEVVTNILKSRFTIKDWMVTDLQKEDTNNTDLELTESIAGIMKNPLFKIEYSKDSNSLTNDGIESNIKKRILNLQEIKSLGLIYGRDDYNQGWFKTGENTFICDEAVGKTVDWCKNNNYVVRDWMIAKEPKEESGLPNIVNSSEGETLLKVTGDGSVYIKGQEFKIKQNNMQTKKVTLKNGTVLEVGKKYTNGKYPFQQLQTVVAIVEDRVWMIDEDGEDDVKSINHNWLPYTEPTPQKEWKTFLIEFSEIKYRAILQFETLEQAQFHHPNAISITEVKINIEPVNN